MLTTSNYSPFPCIGCSHAGICKYEESVMSFCRSNNAPSTIDCLTLEYKCKHREVTYSTALRTEVTPCVASTTSTAVKRDYDAVKTYSTNISPKYIN